MLRAKGGDGKGVGGEGKGGGGDATGNVLDQKAVSKSARRFR